tara:strand:+ start:828 stop:1094 length:267 start_codon:yes stop_codon:yes gene_type:complete
VGVGTFVEVPFRWGGFDNFAKRDDACGASVNAQGATSAHVVVNDEDRVVGWVKAGEIGVNRFVDGFHGHVVDAFPWANIDTTFTLDAF